MARLKEIFSVDLRSLALFRIVLASAILINLATLAPDIEAFYSDQGIFPRSPIVQVITWTPSIYFATGTVWGVAILFLIQALFAILLLIGWRTRLTTFISWFFSISLQVRNYNITNGGDYLIGLMLFWGMFLPLGARFSFDRVQSSSKTKLPKTFCSVATVALFVQFASLYLFGSLYKQDQTWKDGTALYYSLSDEYFATSLGLFLSHFRTPLKILSYCVRPFEFFGPLLLIFPFFTTLFRMIGIAAFFIFQAALGTCISLMLFPFTSSILLLPFVPSAFWDRLARLFKLKNSDSDLTETRMRPSWLAQTLCFFFLLYVISWQISEWKPQFMRIPSFLQWLGPTLQISQFWGMYSETPKNSGWFAVIGKLQGGSVVDLYRKGKPWREEKPSIPSQDHPSFRWRYLVSEFAYKDSYEPYLFYYANWLCTKWNAKQDGPNRLMELEIVDIRLLIPAEKNSRQSPKEEKLSVFKHSCP